MRLLLDTHAFLWFAGGSPRLSERAKSAIEAESNDILVSVASLWEIAVKTSLGKMKLASSFDDVISEAISVTAAKVLPIGLSELVVVATLPFHHRDPFDRLLVAQAQVERLTIVSVDDLLDDYGIQRIW
ncbi:MAG: type II toxin-antitoxin system VapC family toxin [Pirellulales bacterium]